MITLVFFVLTLAVSAVAALRYQALKKDVEDKRAYLATAQSKAAYVEDSVYGLRDLGERSAELCSGTTTDPKLEQFCERTKPYFERVKLFTEATFLRADAKDPDTYVRTR